MSPACHGPQALCCVHPAAATDFDVALLLTAVVSADRRRSARTAPRCMKGIAGDSQDCTGKFFVAAGLRSLQEMEMDRCDGLQFTRE